MDMKITVLITSYNDPRIEQTLISLQNQTLKPDEIFVADGGTSWDIKSMCDKYGARLEILKGNIPETRNKAISMVTSDIVVFIDTDQIAPDQWLDTITKPIRDGKADFVGGPTRHFPPKSSPELYIDELEDAMYANLVANDIRYLPMGNSAWLVRIFKDIGGFDASLYGSEDYDVNAKAVQRGYRGLYVEDAWVYHEHSDINSYWKLMRKRYKYLKTTAQIYRRNGLLGSRIKIRGKYKVKHPFVIVEELMKPIAFIDSFLLK